jgi:hypothetical protein
MDLPAHGTSFIGDGAQAMVPLLHMQNMAD